MHQDINLLCFILHSGFIRRCDRVFFASVFQKLLPNLSPFWLIRQNVGVAFQEELSDLLLLKMLQAATRAASDKDKVTAFTHNTSNCFSSV